MIATVENADGAAPAPTTFVDKNVKATQTYTVKGTDPYTVDGQALRREKQRGDGHGAGQARLRSRPAMTRRSHPR